VLISGAGIGGLTTALCCIHKGLQVTLLEKAAELTEVGAGIQIPPNAMKVFEALGVQNFIAEKAFKSECIETRMGQSGASIFSISLGDYVLKRWGAPYYHIHRADLISALEAALLATGKLDLLTNTEVIGYTQSKDQVQVKLADGSTVKGDAFIGADGIHSPTRNEMHGLEQPRFTGNVAWRCVAPVEKLDVNAPAPNVCVWMGSGRHCTTYRLRGGELANLVAVVERDDWKSESWTEQGSREEALEDFKDWHPVITRMLESADKLFRWALFDRPPLSSWCDGRVALLGDAAHPMPPFFAQGAAMAIEDAWAISHYLSIANGYSASNSASTSSIDVQEALKRYQSLRYQRATSVQSRSRANVKTFHQTSLAGKLKTYGPMWIAGKVMPSIVYRQLDSLYAYDITQAVHG